MSRGIRVEAQRRCGRLPHRRHGRPGSCASGPRSSLDRRGNRSTLEGSPRQCSTCSPWVHAADCELGACLRSEGRRWAQVQMPSRASWLSLWRLLLAARRSTYAPLMATLEPHHRHPGCYLVGLGEPTPHLESAILRVRGWRPTSCT